MSSKESTKEIKLEASDWEVASTKKMISYSFGYLIGSAIGGAFLTAVFYYYEVEVGMNVALLGLAIFIYGLYNMFNNPLFGYLTDKPFRWTKKWGMRFPWIMIGIFPTIILYYFLFAIPENLIGDDWGLFWYFLIVACLLDTFYSIFLPQIHGGVASHFRTEYERRKFTAINNTIPGLLTIPISLIVLFIIVYGDRQSFVLAALIGVIVWLILAVCLIPGVRESEKLKESFIKGYETSGTKTFWNTMKVGLGRRNFAVSTIALTLVSLAGALYYGSLIYFWKDIVGLPLWYAVFTTLTAFVGFILGVPVWMKYAKKHGFKKTYALGLLLMALSYLNVLWISTLYESIFASFIGGFTAACATIMFAPIVMDCYDDVVTVTGRRDEATLQGIRNFFFRISIVLYGPIFAIVHIIFGYNPDPSPYTVQTPMAIWGIRVHMGVIPMILTFIAFLIVWKYYDLEGAKKQEMISKLREMGL